MNSVNIIGRLTREPESRDLGGHQKAAFGIAVNDGKDKAIFIDVAAWDKTAQLCMRLQKGEQIGITGRMSVDQWEDRETGQRRTKVYVTATRISFIGSKPQQDREPYSPPQAPAFPPAGPDIGDGQNMSGQEDSIDDIPF